MLYLGHLTVSFWHRMWSAKEKRGDVVARSPLHVVQTTALTLCGWTVACLTELLSRRSNIHNWPNNRGEGMSEELAAESADGHRPWLLSECEMPKPYCSPEPGGQRRSRLLSPTQKASKTIWHEDFIQAPPPKKPQTLLLAPAFNCLYIKARLHCQAKTCSPLSSAGNNNCFPTFLRDFVMGAFFLFFFLHLPVLRECRQCAGWLKSNVAVDICLPSCHCVPLFIITAAEEENGWVAQTPCPPFPPFSWGPSTPL